MTNSLMAGLLLLAFAALTACGASPTAPSEQGPLRLTGEISQTVVARGSTATLIFRLENLGSDPVTLDFGSSCQIQPYIASRPGIQVVYPQGGSWACAAVITQLTLPPRGSALREVSIQAATAASHPHVALPPGEYVAYAKLDDRKYRLESALVLFLVQ